MLGFLNDITKGIGNVIGTITGTIIGVSVTIIAETLGITIDMVNEATKAGCTTYEEIRTFHKL